MLEYSTIIKLDIVCLVAVHPDGLTTASSYISNLNDDFFPQVIKILPLSVHHREVVIEQASTSELAAVANLLVFA